MNFKDEDSLNQELAEITSELESVDQQLIYFEIQKANLLKRKKDCLNQLKDLKPTSSGGNRQESTSNWNRNDFKWSNQIVECLKTTFKLEAFRALQLETINVTLSRQDCLVVMPTGGGKSLCYQLPAIIDTGITLVISPLISLMEDQIWALRSLEIDARMMTSTSSKETQKEILAAMLDPKSDMKLLYVTPEKLAKSKMFMNKLEKMYDMGRFHRLVVDEVHCCSTYGHDFRPDYKYLGIMKRQFPNISILGLTATATINVLNDIKEILNLKDFVLFKASFNRPNLYYEIRDKPSNHEECIRSIADLISTKFPNQSGIIYCFSQRESELVANDLRKWSIKADPYHAQIDANQRAKVHNSWLNNKTDVIVATIAFGMGIDKPNCRFVIHHSLSKSLENFYQESGRAGRDGLKAFSILYFRYADCFRQSSMVFTERTGLENLYSMVRYCFDKSVCKRRLIAAHFKDHVWLKTGDCGRMCDVCSSDTSMKEIDCIFEVEILFGILEKHSGKDKRLTANKLAELCVAEVTKNKSLTNKMDKYQVEQMVLELLLRQFLREEFSYTAYNTICYLVKGDGMGPKGSFKINVPESSKSVKIGWATSEDVKKSSLIKKKEKVKNSYRITNDEIINEELMPPAVIKDKTSQLLSGGSKRKSEQEIFILNSSSDDEDENIKKKQKN